MADYQARVIEDTSWQGNRLLTIEATYPLWIHQELLTHRVFSRNASSNRALPILKVVGQVIKNPSYPVWWGRNQRGMSAEAELSGWRLWLCRQLWFAARYLAVAIVLVLYYLGLHKQLANRLLSPWQWITTVYTATEWDNFFRLRCHPDAQPEAQRIAWLMRAAMQQSVPTERRWHLPYITADERTQHTLFDLIKVSVARCARVSYLTQASVRPIQKDIGLYEQLCDQDPEHASPQEHVARGSEWPDETSYNLRGFESWRYITDNNYLDITHTDLLKVIA